MKYYSILILLCMIVVPCTVKCEESKYTKWNLEVSQAYMYSTNTLFKDAYGKAYPTFAGISYQPRERVKFISGLRLFKKSGHTILEPGDQNIPPDDISLTHYSIPVDVYYAFKSEKFSPYVLFGFNYTIYKETWKDEPISVTKKGLGFETGLGIIFYTRDKLSLSGGFLYSYASVKNEASIENTTIPCYNFFVQLTWGIK